MKTIIGSFRTTPIDALLSETGLQPPELQLQHKVLRSFTRIQIPPASHPLHSWLQKARNERDKPKGTYTSNLENLTIKFPTHTAPAAVETTHPYIRPRR
jgi:hypothetical protein